jgi:HKD family nuclease
MPDERHPRRFGDITKHIHPCLICGKDKGKQLEIKGGIVCEDCMPYELSKSVRLLTFDEVTSYHKNNLEWISVGSQKRSSKRGNDIKTGGKSSMFFGGTDKNFADELNKSINEADGIDILVSFIHLSGIKLIIEALKKFTEHNRLRIITTTYMGVTDPNAILLLASLKNTEIRVESRADNPTLHAKAFIFYNKVGCNVAYVGSANLSRTALEGGKEWIVKICEQDMKYLITETIDEFNKMWNSCEYVKFTANDVQKLQRMAESSKTAVNNQMWFKKE